MNQPTTIVVLESTPRWVPELQRQFEQEPFSVKACRTAIDFRERLQATQITATPIIAVIDLAVGLSNGLTLVDWLAGSNVIGTIIIGNAEAVTLEPVLRELGATSVHVDSISGVRLAKECRQFTRSRESR